MRAKYLVFIRDLGEFTIDGRSVIDHLELDGGFSFWWMTTLAEKSPLKSPRIYDCLRLFALEEMLKAMQPATVSLASADEALARAVEALCGNLGMRFSRYRVAAPRKTWTVRRVYEAMPHSLKALLSLRHVIARWPLRKALGGQPFSGAGAVFICSYFIHLDADECARGRFHSRQWESLPGSLISAGRTINWLQLFLISTAVPNVCTGLAWALKFNADAAAEGHHAFLDSYLSVGVVLRAFARWLRLTNVRWRLRRVQSAFCPGDSSLSLWPMLREDWASSLNGTVGMGNCLAVEQFEQAMARLPHQADGLFLCENQAWEKALLRAWRRHGHGRIVGVQHATAPFWHLYYFDDPRSLQPRTRCSMPLPDLLAVNGDAARSAFLAAGYPAGRLVEVEALRYLGLRDIVNARSYAGARRAAGGKARDIRRPARVLIVGDMIPASMHHLLSIIESAMMGNRSRYELTFKAHPGYSVDLSAYRELMVAVTGDSLGKILNDYDIAIAANSTSAAVDAYVAGLPVIIGLNGAELNLSPLRGMTGVRFVTSPEELLDALEIARKSLNSPVVDGEPLFHLHPGLPRWKRLLSYDEPAPEDGAATFTAPLR